MFDWLKTLLLPVENPSVTQSIVAIMPVSYTHLDVYKRQRFGYHGLGCGYAQTLGETVSRALQ